MQISYTLLEELARGGLEEAKDLRHDYFAIIAYVGHNISIIFDSKIGDLYLNIEKCK